MYYKNVDQYTSNDSEWQHLQYCYHTNNDLPWAGYCWWLLHGLAILLASGVINTKSSARKFGLPQMFELQGFWRCWNWQLQLLNRLLKLLDRVIADGIWFKVFEAKNWCIQSSYSRATPASRQLFKHFCSPEIMQQAFLGAWAVVTIKAGFTQACLNEVQLCDCKSSSVVPPPGNWESAKHCHAVVFLT